MLHRHVSTISWVAIGVLVITLLAIVIVDLYLIWSNHDGPTVSSTILDIAYRYPAIVLVVGFVLGHLFWPQRRG